MSADTFTDKEIEAILDERDEAIMRIIRLEERVHNLEIQEENLQNIIQGMSERIAAQSELLSKRANK